MLETRPRLLNLLHSLGLASPVTQTNDAELECLRRHASGRRTAVEIGTFQGVSARVIADSLSPGGVLYCVDPWPSVAGRESPVYSIARRHLAQPRSGVRIAFLRLFSRDAAEALPSSIDFAFIDGDHSYEGLAADWDLIAGRVREGGVVCGNDTTVPAAEPERTHGSVKYFEDVIRVDRRYAHVETVHSLNALRRCGPDP